MQKEDFQEYLQEHLKPPNMGPYKVLRTVRKIYKKSAPIQGDMHMKFIDTFAKMNTHSATIPGDLPF